MSDGEYSEGFCRPFATKVVTMHSSVTAFPSTIGCSDVETEATPIPIKPWPGRVIIDSKLAEIERLGERCKDGDASAWTALFPMVWPVLVRFINRLYHSLDEQDAEDVAQASLQAAIKGIHTFSGDGLFRAWLFGIASQRGSRFARVGNLHEGICTQEVDRNVQQICKNRVCGRVGKEGEEGQ